MFFFFFFKYIYFFVGATGEDYVVFFEKMIYSFCFSMFFCVGEVFKLFWLVGILMYFACLASLKCLFEGTTLLKFYVFETFQENPSYWFPTEKDMTRNKIKTA